MARKVRRMAVSRQVRAGRLQEKVSAPSVSGSVKGAPVIAVSHGDEDAVVALMTLGFTRAESEKAIARARAGGANSVEDIIMSALRGM